MAPRPTEQIEPGTLNILLGLYLISAKKKDWGEYEPISLNSSFASINFFLWYLDGKNYHENVVTSDFFKGTRDALPSKEKELKAMGMGNTPNKVCFFVCGISLTSGQLIIELFPDCTRSCFSQVVLRRRGGDRIYEMRCLFVAVGPNARFMVLPHWDNMS